MSWAGCKSACRSKSRFPTYFNLWSLVSCTNGRRCISDRARPRFVLDISAINNIRIGFWSFAEMCFRGLRMFHIIGVSEIVSKRRDQCKHYSTIPESLQRYPKLDAVFPFLANFCVVHMGSNNFFHGKCLLIFFFQLLITFQQLGNVMEDPLLFPGCFISFVSEDEMSPSLCWVVWWHDWGQCSYVWAHKMAHEARDMSA